MGNVEMEPTKPESNGVTKTTDSSGKTDPLLVQVNNVFLILKNNEKNSVRILIRATQK